ncbi:M48 family metalloprotease [Novosphingobium sp.]|uniref:M48 family metalloprotease n=1 Tax=Novosphingobium sp. TaxID=1874826 RepID=UPI0025F83993|nr:M48 family metalloprotease [Novosphingobium sp.]
MRVNGLYGHVAHNDKRSIQLLGGFVLSFQMIAIVSLWAPLAMWDPAHAPFENWTGYLLRWVPLTMIAGAGLFALQFAWHVRTVQKQTGFRFVDNADEPRLCRIIEPLIIAAGLPTPYVAVIDSPARNAFACGIRAQDAVLVFTRGLIDGLDDEELAAVAAHEIAHIKAGDIRLIAATNVCVGTLEWFTHRQFRKVPWYQESLSLILSSFMLPVIVPLYIGFSTLRQQALRGAHLTRLMVSSARELVADAEAVRLTQNPAALVSALRAIDGRSGLGDLSSGQDAMMIDGATDGPTASHPTIAERIAAIVAVTGSMALVAPSRRDTREPSQRPGGFGRRAALVSTEAPTPAAPARHRATAGNGRNWLGLTPATSWGALIACSMIAGIHAQDLTTPAGIARTFDVRVVGRVLNLAVGCQTEGFSATRAALIAGVNPKPNECDDMSQIFKSNGPQAGH